MDTDGHRCQSAAEGIWSWGEDSYDEVNKPLWDNFIRSDDPLIKETPIFFIKTSAYLNLLNFLYQPAPPVSRSDIPTHSRGFIRRGGFQPTDSAQSLAFPSRSDGSRTWGFIRRGGFQSRRPYTIREPRPTMFGPKVRADTSPVRRRTEACHAEGMGPFAGRETESPVGTRAEGPRKSPPRTGTVNLCGSRDCGTRILVSLAPKPSPDAGSARAAPASGLGWYRIGPLARYTPEKCACPSGFQSQHAEVKTSRSLSRRYATNPPFRTPNRGMNSTATRQTSLRDGGSPA